MASPAKGSPETDLTTPSGLVFASAEDKAKYELQQRKLQDFEKFKHYAAMTMIVLTPTLMILPPRKFDLYTIALSGGFVMSASQLSKETYGMGLIDLAGSRFAQYRARVAAEESQAASPEKKNSQWAWSASLPTDKAREIQQQIKESRNPSASAQQPEKQSLLMRLWLGGESANWKEERAKEHQEALESGETIGDLVRAQINEVFGFGDKESDESSSGQQDEKQDKGK